MTRINVYRYDDGKILDGWFEMDTAEEFDERMTWNGDNNVSMVTGSQHNHQVLYRTRGGRWVLHCWSQWQGSQESYEFISDDDAKTWLLRNEDDEAVAKYFGPVPGESGPGRPREGTAISTRLRDEQIAMLDELAREHGVSRADLIRSLIDASLAASAKPA